MSRYNRERSRKPDLLPDDYRPETEPSGFLIPPTRLPPIAVASAAFVPEPDPLPVRIKAAAASVREVATRRLDQMVRGLSSAVRRASERLAAR